MSEANCTVVGGHSIRDDELKFGYAVTGLIDPAKVWRNVGARPGDVLLLTKPLGTGVISTAVKSGRAEEASVARSTASMTRLNREAAETLRQIEIAANGTEGGGCVHAVTDVTGFGLLGHAREMAIGSGVSMRLDHQQSHIFPARWTQHGIGFSPEDSRTIASSWKAVLILTRACRRKCRRCSMTRKHQAVFWQR